MKANDWIGVNAWLPDDGDEVLMALASPLGYWIIVHGFYRAKGFYDLHGNPLLPNYWDGIRPPNVELDKMGKPQSPSIFTARK